MGCAPSIHVSQSGIVYCREEIREPSSGARASSLSEVINHIHSEPGATALTSTVRITRGRFPSLDKRKSVETDTQSFDLRKMEEISQVRIKFILRRSLTWKVLLLVPATASYFSRIFPIFIPS
jgi:hypothetical protein